MTPPRDGITLRPQDVPQMDNATLIDECARLLGNMLTDYTAALGKELQRRFGNG